MYKFPKNVKLRIVENALRELESRHMWYSCVALNGQINIAVLGLTSNEAWRVAVTCKRSTENSAAVQTSADPGGGTALCPPSLQMLTMLALSMCEPSLSI